MAITKFDLKVLRFIYSKRTVSFKLIKKRFGASCPDISDQICGMISENCVKIESGVRIPILGNSIPDSCILALASKGASIVESEQ